MQVDAGGRALLYRSDSITFLYKKMKNRFLTYARTGSDAGGALSANAAPARARAAILAQEVQAGAEWHELYEAVSQPHLPQLHAYGEAKRKAGLWYPVRLVFRQGAQPVAICQALEVRVAGLCVGVRINRGPLFLDAEPDWHVREQVMYQLRRRWGLLHGGPLLIAPALAESEEHREMMRALGYRERVRAGWCSSLIDLRLSDDEIRRRMTSTWRNRLKTALSSDLSLRVTEDAAAMEWMIERHEENMRAKKFSGPRRALLRALHRGGTLRVLQAVAAGEPVGGLLLASFGCAAEYYVGWFGEAGRRRNCGNFLYWHALREARRLGHRWFDLGGYYSDDKFGRFKQNMRGIEYRLCGEWIGI